MSIDLIALDLDGTLLNRHDEVSVANRTAIRDALEAGIRVVLVTGRGAETPIRVSADLELNLPVICCHGALTKDFLANRTLGHIPVPLQYAKAMVEYAEENGLSLALYTEETFYRLKGSTLYMDDMTGPHWREVHSFAEVLHVAPTFLRFLGRESVDAMREQFGNLPLHFKYETWYDFIECAVTNAEATKEHALAQLCRTLEVPRERVLALGDSRNDVPMMQWAGVGVAMANALPEVRDAVRFCTESNDRDGVALAIRRFALDPLRAVEKKPA